MVDSWQSSMRAMQREWDGISACRARTLVAEWRVAMVDMRRRRDRHVADGRWLAGPSDFLGIVGLARHENVHSRMLQWLLTPSARHGMGSGLAQRLVEHCTGEPASEPLTVRRVAFSVWRNDREADLVVWGRDFTLVIENKVDADEQPGQCDDLHANFRNETAPLFLFLSPTGRTPATATTADAQRAFKSLSWPGLRTMLAEALSESPSPADAASAVDVVGNYLRTLAEQFG